MYRTTALVSFMAALMYWVSNTEGCFVPDKAIARFGNMTKVCGQEPDCKEKCEKYFQCIPKKLYHAESPDGQIDFQKYKEGIISDCTRFVKKKIGAWLDKCYEEDKTCGSGFFGKIITDVIPALCSDFKALTAPDCEMSCDDKKRSTKHSAWNADAFVKELIRSAKATEKANARRS